MECLLCKYNVKNRIRKKILKIFIRYIIYNLFWDLEFNSDNKYVLNFW